VHAYLRQSLAGLYGANVARETRILYGGSVTPDNVDDIMARADIDGVLVGGASLDAAAFNKIVAFTPTQSIPAPFVGLFLPKAPRSPTDSTSDAFPIGRAESPLRWPRLRRFMNVLFRTNY
jgi:hypothetical protein